MKYLVSALVTVGFLAAGVYLIVTGHPASGVFCLVIALLTV